MNTAKQSCTHLGNISRFPDDYSQDVLSPHHCLKDHRGTADSEPPYPPVNVEERNLPETFERRDDEKDRYLRTDVPEPPKTSGTPIMMDKLDKNDYILKEYKKKEDKINPPCFLPQQYDDVPAAHEPHGLMGPLGPWATGHVDWSPLAGLTGTRPVVDKCSITRFSVNEWRQRNKDLLDNCFDTFENMTKNENYCKNTMIKTYAMVDQTQADSTNRLKDRARLVDKWKNTLQRAIAAMIDEITTMEEERLRLKDSLAVLRMPESIASECLDVRCQRPETELVRDIPEEQLMRELSLIAEIRKVLNQTLIDIEAQQAENRAARHRLEADWSDKFDTHNIESINCGLNNHSKTIMFKSGATRFPEEQSSEEYWEHYTKEALDAAEMSRQKSILLRSTLDAILMNAARDLRNQADTVEKALTDRISCMQQILTRLENELKECLQRLADTENLIIRLKRGTQGLDYPMKVVQTRLDNRNQRPYVDNCRDRTHFGLVNEVETVQFGVSNMLEALNNAERTKQNLMNTRGRLEREIMLKRRTLMLDKNRCMLIRSHFPSAVALSGYSKVLE